MGAPYTDLSSRRRALLGLSALGVVLHWPRLGRAAPPRGTAPRKTSRGLFVNQGTAENEDKLDGLIRLCTSFGVDTLIVDLYAAGPRYRRGVRQILAAGLRYVPRVVVFPKGGTENTVRSRYYWQKRLTLVNQGLDLGASRVQLDYIRYSADRDPSASHARDILQVIRWFGERIHERGATFEIDVFGEVALTPSPRIGQDLGLFGPHVDGVCPMVYPSHFKPYSVSWKLPYELVHQSISAARTTLGPRGPRLDAYIEMFNFRKPMSNPERALYVRRQAQAAIAAGAAGWYAWSATNSYGMLFDLLALYGDSFERP